MTVERIHVAHDTLSAAGENTEAAAKGNKLGYQIVMDFYTQMAIEERVFNVFAGDISVPFVGDVVITDTAAELCVDAASGTTIIPVVTDISINLGTGTLHEYAGKSVGAVSTVGDVFVPLNTSLGGPSASGSSARADAQGGVTVAAEVATTTRRLFGRGGPIAQGAYLLDVHWEPRTPSRVNGAGCFYVQIAATGTGPSYFASIDYIQLPTVNLD